MRGVRSGAKSVVQNRIKDLCEPRPKKIFLWKIWRDSGWAEFRGLRKKNGKTPLFHQSRKCLHSGLWDGNWAHWPKENITKDFEAGRVKHELKGIDNTFSGFTMDILYLHGVILSPLPPLNRDTITPCLLHLAYWAGFIPDSCILVFTLASI